MSMKFIHDDACITEVLYIKFHQNLVKDSKDMQNSSFTPASCLYNVAN